MPRKLSKIRSKVAKSYWETVPPEERSERAREAGRAAGSWWRTCTRAEREKRLEALAEGRRKAYKKRGSWLTSGTHRRRGRAKPKAAAPAEA